MLLYDVICCYESFNSSLAVLHLPDLCQVLWEELEDRSVKNDLVVFLAPDRGESSKKNQGSVKASLFWQLEDFESHVERFLFGGCRAAQNR